MLTFPRHLQADGKPHDEGDDRALRMSAPLTLLAAADGDAKRIRRFEMDAYNGGAMRFWWSDVPVVVDLDGMEISEKARPILKDHNTSLIVGHTQKITAAAGKLRVSGMVSGAGQVAREVVESADNGFPWQASIGADILSQPEQVRAGVEVRVNGQTFKGPLAIVRASRLSEVSFVALGADDSTAARMAAGRNSQTNTHKEPVMKKSRITLVALLALAAAFPHLTAQLNERADLADDEDDAAKKGADDLKAWAEAQEKPAVTAAAPAAGEEGEEEVDAVKASRKTMADETRRVAGIRKVCAGKYADVEAKAIEEGWSVEKAELHVLRAARPAAPAIIGGASAVDMNADLLECAVMQSMRVASVGGLEAGEIDRGRAQRIHAEAMEAYPEKIRAAADRRFRGRISLGRLLIEAAYANGYTGRESLRENPREILMHAFGVNAYGLKAAASTIDIGGILSNVANKSLLMGFQSIEQAWRAIAAIGNLSDFKQVTRYRLTGDNTYEEVAPDGKIKQGKLGEESFTNRLKTYAKMLNITRADLINDDLGALTAVPQILGRGAARKFNNVFWTEFLADHSTFFPTDLSEGNYQEGAATALSIDSLTAAEQLFFDQTDSDDEPLGIDAAKLLVPTALNAKAAQLMNSTEIRDTTASTKYGVSNPHNGKWDVVMSRYLSNSRMSGGYSAKAWYLVADPNDLPVIEAGFLNGVETPTVESAAADFDELGISMRGFHDFGVKKQDKRAAVKSKGEA